jgi:hypothetical protein
LYYYNIYLFFFNKALFTFLLIFFLSFRAGDDGTSLRASTANLTAPKGLLSIFRQNSAPNTTKGSIKSNMNVLSNGGGGGSSANCFDMVDLNKPASQSELVAATKAAEQQSLIGDEQRGEGGGGKRTRHVSIANTNKTDQVFDALHMIINQNSTQMIYVDDDFVQNIRLIVEQTEQTKRRKLDKNRCFCRLFTMAFFLLMFMFVCLFLKTLHSIALNLVQTNSAFKSALTDSNNQSYLNYFSVVQSNNQSSVLLKRL